jgi:hypothetical protein
MVAGHIFLTGVMEKDYTVLHDGLQMCKRAIQFVHHSFTSPDVFNLVDWNAHEWAF